MSPTLDVTCPNCNKEIKVPVEFAGKSIRCKDCKTAFRVPGAASATPAKPARPAAARPAAPVAAKPVSAKPADPNAPIPFKEEEPPPPPPAPKRAPIDDDDDDNPNPYGVTHDDLDVPRCPFCAKELDPPDTKVCLNCGYDLLQRRRHDTRKVYETTTGDYLLHWLPGVACVLAAIVLIALAVVCSLNMSTWLTGSFLDSDEKNEITGKPVFYVPPFCFNIWIGVICVWLSYKALKFAFARLVIKWRPEEVVKRT